MNTWSGIPDRRPHQCECPVQASWADDAFPRAAEIMRYTYRDWSDPDIARFKNMLTTQFLPSLIHGICENGNKELTRSEALINIVVFSGSRTAFEHGLKTWRGRAPTYIYYLPERRWSEAS